ncbi:AAA family ATPase [Paenibacillus sp. FSL R10-2748]|uniref:AAA family ATPase n=1 Tax=Paenibacillus sp. FSL R10-2748 TaxID=2954658 RepID=UPI0030FC7710
MPYISKQTLREALQRMKGTADHMLKIWFVLKVMGLKDGESVEIDTGNSTPSLNRLFSFGEADGSFFIPFAHTKRFMTMKSDASRSIIQTTIQRWLSSGSVVTINPTSYLDIAPSQSGRTLYVTKGRSYPEGLGYGKNGFALSDDSRVSIPNLSFAIWLLVREGIPEGNSKQYLIERMFEILNLNNVEYELIFTRENFEIEFQEEVLTEAEINEICKNSLVNTDQLANNEIFEANEDYKRRIRRMVTVSSAPAWLKQDPKVQVSQLIDSGERAILLYGPPRTGKTRVIDSIVPRDSDERVSIQLHEGWTYENLIIGLQPETDTDRFSWKLGPLAKAIQEKKKYIVVEEINRTKISQALGEVFSLIEAAYRGEENGIILPNGEKLWIDSEVMFFFTMNTLDESTEDVDDALLGRMACIEFPPRLEDLADLLAQREIEKEVSNKIKDFYNIVLEYYPLGHGYFAGLTKESNFISYYVSRVRPTLQNHFQSARSEIVDQIDNAVDGVFR